MACRNREVNRHLVKLPGEGIPLVATNDVHYWTGGSETTMFALHRTGKTVHERNALIWVII